MKQYVLILVFIFTLIFILIWIFLFDFLGTLFASFKIYIHNYIHVLIYNYGYISIRIWLGPYSDPFIHHHENDTSSYCKNGTKQKEKTSSKEGKIENQINQMLELHLSSMLNFLHRIKLNWIKRYNINFSCVLQLHFFSSNFLPFPYLSLLLSCTILCFPCPPLCSIQPFPALTHTPHPSNHFSLSLLTHL